MESKGFAFILLIFFGSVAHAKSFKSRLSTLHHEIGNTLIQIKKEHPQAQSIIFTVLDQFGQYHSVAKNVAEKYSVVKKRIVSGNREQELLRQEVIMLEEKVGKMKQLVVEASDRLKREATMFQRFQEQKEQFERERREFFLDKERFEQAKKQMLSEEVAVDAKGKIHHAEEQGLQVKNNARRYRGKYAHKLLAE